MRTRPCHFEPGTWVRLIIGLPRRGQGRGAKWTIASIKDLPCD